MLNNDDLYEARTRARKAVTSYWGADDRLDEGIVWLIVSLLHLADVVSDGGSKTALRALDLYEGERGQG